MTQRSNLNLTSLGPDIAKEKDDLLEKFFFWAKALIRTLDTRLGKEGHWTVFIDPCSGLPIARGEKEKGNEASQGNHERLQRQAAASMAAKAAAATVRRLSQRPTSAVNAVLSQKARDEGIFCLTNGNTERSGREGGVGGRPTDETEGEEWKEDEREKRAGGREEEWAAVSSRIWAEVDSFRCLLRWRVVSAGGCRVSDFLFFP